MPATRIGAISWSCSTSPRTKPRGSTPTLTVYETLEAGSPVQMVPAIRTILGGFLFSGDDIYKKVGGALGRRAHAPGRGAHAAAPGQHAAARRAHQPPRPRLEGRPARRARGLRRHARSSSRTTATSSTSWRPRSSRSATARLRVYPGTYEEYLWSKAQAARPAAAGRQSAKTRAPRAAVAAGRPGPTPLARSRRRRMTPPPPRPAAPQRWIVTRRSA